MLLVFQHMKLGKFRNYATDLWFVLKWRFDSCWCNGGSDGVNEVPPLSPSPSQSFHPTAATLAPTTTVGICEDALGWQNLEGRDCSWFAKDSERCTLVSNENSTDTLSEWLNGTASDQFYLGTISVLQACCGKYHQHRTDTRLFETKTNLFL